MITGSESPWHTNKRNNGRAATWGRHYEQGRHHPTSSLVGPALRVRIACGLLTGCFMQIRCELVRIMITETGDHQVIVLKESEGKRAFPIVIGFFEAAAIDRRIKGHVLPRPMTHELLSSVIEAMGGRLQKVIVTDLKDHTFFADLVIHRNGAEVHVDARPSDAIALAVAGSTPIFVEEHVLNEVAGPKEGGISFNT